jgi:amidohydrolase
MTELKNRVVQDVEALRLQLTELSRRMYHEPELGLQEYRASAWLTDMLAEAGFMVERGTAGMPTAFRARLSGGGPGPRVALLAEYDALPGIGHGCGHNIIGTAAVGAAVALARSMPGLSGELVVLGTPAEEGAVDNAGGKVVMVESGVFSDVDAAIMVHPSSRTTAGGTSNARVALEMRFYGKSAHAAGAPQEGINALDAAIQTFNGWNALRQHVKGDVRIHGVITKGGVSPNIVPDYAEIRMYVRAQDTGYLKEVEAKVKRCAEGAALATGARVEFRYTAHTYANMRNNRVLSQAFMANLAALDVPITPGESVSGGSTDMGNVSQVVPAIHPYIAMCPPGVASHSREFADATVTAEGEAALMNAAKALAMTVIDIFTTSQLVENAKREFSGS